MAAVSQMSGSATFTPAATTAAGPRFRMGTHCVSGEHAIAVTVALAVSQNETILVSRLKWSDAGGRHRVLLARTVAVPAGTTFHTRYVIHESLVRNLDVTLSTATEGFAAGSSPFGPC